MTAVDLLAAIASFDPSPDGEGLAYDEGLPEDLERLVAVLHTGVRAIMTGREWWGSTVSATVSGQNGLKRLPRVVQLDPSKCLPHDIQLLSVEGDSRWDRINLAIVCELPAVWAREKKS